MEVTYAAATADPERHCPRCGKWFERKDTVKRHLKTHDRVRKQHKSKKRNCAACISCKVKCSHERPSCARCAQRGLECVYEPPDLPIPPAGTGVATMPVVEMQNTAQQNECPVGQPDVLNWDPFFPTLVDPQILGVGAPNTFNDILTAYLGSLPLENFDIHASSLEERPLPMGQDQQPVEREEQSDNFNDSVHKDNEQRQLVRLPILAEGHRSHYPRRFSLLQVDDQAYENLQSCLRAPSTRIPWQPMSLDCFPSKDILDSLVDLYFANFDEFLPMIHRPTFDPGENAALTLAMCAIGSCYSNFENRHHFAKSLCEMLRRLLLFMGEYDASITRSESHLAAQLLQSVLGKASGSKRLYELGDNNRGILVSNARGMGLFDYQSQTFREENDAQSRWEAWVRTEKSKRLAWCIYVSVLLAPRTSAYLHAFNCQRELNNLDFDASATYYRNCRPNLSLFEIRMTLPCTIGDWEAGSAQAWAASHPWTPAAPEESFLQDTIDRLFERSTIPFDEFQRMLLATTLVRIVWDQRESLREPVRSSSNLGRSALPQNIGTVLDGLSKLTTGDLTAAALKINKPSLGCTERQFRGLVLRARVDLIAQIIAAENVTDHLALICSRQSNQSAAAEAAETRLRDWARADPSQPRRLAHVGAKLLAISRLYVFNYPREPFDALQGGLLVCTMLRLLRSVQPNSHQGMAVATTPLGFSNSSPASGSGSRCSSSPPAVTTGGVLSAVSGRSCRLDWLGGQNTPEAAAIQEWIVNDGPFVLGIHGVADMRSPMGEKQVLLETARVLDGLRVWGIGTTYAEIIMRVLESEYG